MSDPAALTQGLAGVFGPGAVVQGLKRLSGGASQETWAFDLQQGGATQALILRRAPAGRGTAPQASQFTARRRSER